MPAGMTAFEKDGFLPTVGSRPATDEAGLYSERRNFAAAFCSGILAV